MPRKSTVVSRKQLAHAFSLKLALAIQNRGWPIAASELTAKFNRQQKADPISVYSMRSWLRGEFLPRPHRLLSLAQWLGVPPHELMYGRSYQQLCAQEANPLWVLSDREHRLIQSLRRLDAFDLSQVERLVWRSLGPKGVYAKTSGPKSRRG